MSAPLPGFAAGLKLMLSNTFSISNENSKLDAPFSANRFDRPMSNRTKNGARMSSVRAVQSPATTVMQFSLFAGAKYREFGSGAPSVALYPFNVDELTLNA